ncbi:hypothetical protein AMTRI_Chr05g60020 [Amborella trichopoda]
MELAFTFNPENLVSQPPLESFCNGIQTLQELARQGSWRTILDKISQARKLSLLQKPHEHLVYVSYSVLALVKLRRYGDASEQLETLDDLDSPKYRYETYPDIYPGFNGSMVPFGLRWLHAEMPHRLGKKQEALDRLYMLLDFVREKLKNRNYFSANNSLSSQMSEIHEAKTELSGNSHRGSLETSSTHDVTRDGVLLGSGSMVMQTSFDNQIDRHLVETESSSQEFIDPLRSDTGSNVGFSGDSPELRSNESEEGFGDFFSANNFAGSVRRDSRKNEVQLNGMGVCLCLWKRREEFLINSILSHHLNQKEFNVCVMLIQGLLQQSPSDLLLLSKLGYLQMQLGDLGGSETTLSKVDAILKEDEMGVSPRLSRYRNLINHNRALQFVVAKDYTAAVREYEEAIERDDSDMVAINNKALCLMYSRDLSGSIKVLESALERIPTVALNETIIVNLCSMYELAYVNHTEIKRTLNNWIARIAPDDFDSSCTRI